MAKKNHPEKVHYQSEIEEVEEVEEVEEAKKYPDFVPHDPDFQPRQRNKRPSRVSKFKGVGKRITVPILKLSAGDSLALKFTGEFRQQKIGKDDKPPAMLYRVVDLDTGEVSDLIGSKVLVSTLEKTYPDNLPGKNLVVECSQRSDKKYLDVLISELTEDEVSRIVNSDM